MTRALPALLLASAAIAADRTPVKPVKSPYPYTRFEATEDELHGQKVPDPYRWLENEKSPEVQEWMKAQDQVTRAALAKAPGRDALANRLKQLFYVEAVSAPVKRGGRFFYQRRHADQEKAVLYWRENEKAPEKVLLDPNAWKEDGQPVSLGVWVPSWDGKKLAFAQHPNAADEAVVHVMDVDSGAWSKVDVIPGGKYASPAWTPDNLAFYYTWLPVDPKIPVADRPGFAEIRKHVLGEDPAKDARIHERTSDPTSFLSVDLSRDGKLLFVTVDHGWTQSDLYLQRLGKDKTFKLLVQGNHTQYRVQAWKDQLYIQTDEGAPFKRIFKVSAAAPERKHWKELVPEQKGTLLEHAALVGGHLMLVYLRNATSELRVATLEGKPVRTLKLPGLGTASAPLGLEDDDDAYFTFSSFTVPQQVYKTSLHGGAVELWASVKVPVDPSAFEVSQAWYPSKDGTQVSMFLIHAKDLVKDGSHPVLLTGYGGFDVSMTPGFRASLYPWLEAGGMVAIPNLRGGGEYGREWHEAGMLHRKQNVFDDFAGAAEYLVAQKYAQPARIAIQGGSNGGLLVGAAMVQRPELFGAVICQVPLLDMVRYPLFGSGKTWISEYGDPQQAEDFLALRAYSPYHAVKKGAHYPPLLMMSADHDDRVDPMHARKFAAAIQNATVGGAPAWLRVEKNSGHGGADQVKQFVESYADSYAFLFQTFGMKPGPGPAPGAVH